MKTIFLFCLVMMMSCVDKNLSLVSEDEIINSPEKIKEVWVCHHPGSDHHGEICEEGFHPEGCYVKGDDSKFCWLLKESDCLSDLGLGWQIKACHHLN